MTYDHVHFVTQPRRPVAAQEVIDLEIALGTSMPRGYREYVTTLGIGILNDTVRVYSPARILHDYRSIQTRWNAYFFWDAGSHVLTKSQVLKSIIVADSGSGDEIIFHPSARDTLYILPIDQPTIIAVGPTLNDAIQWLMSQETEAPRAWYFESFPAEAFG
jgi:hypothetical protein